MGELALSWNLLVVQLAAGGILVCTAPRLKLCMCTTLCLSALALLPCDRAAVGARIP